jgi:hypothetical protein
MARKKKSSDSKELATWEDKLAQYAEEALAKESGGGGGTYISTQNGEFTYKGDNLASPFEAIVLDSIIDYAYYDGPFDPDNIATPVCFAIGSDEKELQPHPDCSDPQSDFCRDCWANKYKSDDRGKGKACKNQRRLALVAADVLEEIDIDAEIAFLRISPTSLKYWGGHATKIGKVLKRPPFGVVSEISIEDEKTYFVVKFSVLDKVPVHLLGVMEELMNLCQEELTAPYSVFEDEEVEEPKQKSTGKKKAFRKKKGMKKKGMKKKRKF